MCSVAIPKTGDADHARTLAPAHPAGDHASKSAHTKAAVRRTGHVARFFSAKEVLAEEAQKLKRFESVTPGPKPYPDSTADPPPSRLFPNPYGPSAPIPGYSSRRVVCFFETRVRERSRALAPTGPASAPTESSAGALTRHALNVSRHGNVGGSVAPRAAASKNRRVGSSLCFFPCFEDKYRRNARLRVYTPRSTKETSLGASFAAFSPRTNTASQSGSEPRRDDMSAWRRRTNSPQCAAEANTTPGSRNTRCLLNFFRASSLPVDFRTTTTSFGSNGSTLFSDEPPSPSEPSVARVSVMAGRRAIPTPCSLASRSRVRRARASTARTPSNSGLVSVENSRS